MGSQFSSHARTLRVACAFLVLAIPASVGCRGIIGIEPLEIADGGPDAAPDARGGVDGSAEGGGGEAGGGDAGGGDASPYAACVQQGAMCRPCCHTTFNTANQQLMQGARSGGCFCADAGGECQSECAASLCAGAMPDMTCGPCIDNAVLSPSTPTCMQAVSHCEASQSCRDIIDCMKACP